MKENVCLISLCVVILSLRLSIWKRLSVWQKNCLSKLNLYISYFPKFCILTMQFSSFDHYSALSEAWKNIALRTFPRAPLLLATEAYFLMTYLFKRKSAISLSPLIYQLRWNVLLERKCLISHLSIHLHLLSLTDIEYFLISAEYFLRCFFLNQTQLAHNVVSTFYGHYERWMDIVLTFCARWESNATWCRKR